MDFTQTEQDIKEISRIDLWNGGYVSKYDFSKANSSEAHRIYAVTTIANVCRGDKGIKDRKALYQQLLTEHSGKPGEVFQFIPIRHNPIIGLRDIPSTVRFGFKDKGTMNIYLTNLRALLNTEEPCEYYQDKNCSQGFHVFKMKIPKMIVAHLLRHDQLSFMQQSERHCKLREYYYCDEFELWYKHVQQKNPIKWNDLIYGMSQQGFDTIQSYYKIRQELTNKGSWGLGYTTLWMAGWMQDTTQWQNFFDVRLGKGTQRETRELAEAMKKLMEE